MPFYAIAAMSENRVIGNQGKIPWNIPEDFRWFKHKTMGGTLIMGRKTFESIGKPLPGRKTVIFTHRQLQVPDVEIYSTMSLFEKDCVKPHPEKSYWVCGGGMLYDQFLDRCQYLYLTIVKRNIEGDTLFPAQAQLEKNHQFEQTIHDTSEFRVERWKHKQVPPDQVLPPEEWPFPPRNS